MDRLTFRQFPGPLLPSFEHGRFIEGVTLLLIVECSQNTKLARVGTGRRCEHAHARHAIVTERGLHEFKQRLLKLGLAARPHSPSDGYMDRHDDQLLWRVGLFPAAPG